MDDSLKAELRKAIQEKKIVVFAGTGVTAQATGNAPCATWKSLLENGVNWCESRLPPQVGWADTVKKLLDLNDADSWVTAAKKITDRLKPNPTSTGEFKKWLEQSVGSLAIKNPEILEALKQLGAPIVTTNYDGLISEHIGQPHFTWREQDKLHAFLQGNESGVFHLHGHWQDHESVVFDFDSYADVRRNEFVEAFRQTIGLRNILFVGFGAGLDDDHFKQWKLWMGKILPDLKDSGHYLLVKDSEVTDAWKHFEGGKIRPIGYGKDHHYLVPFLQSLVSPEAILIPPLPLAPLPPTPLRGIKTIQSATITFRDLDENRPLPTDPAAQAYYFARPSDRELDQALSDSSKRLVVVKGGPMAGKTRTIVEALRRQPDQQILVPEADQAEHWSLSPDAKAKFLVFNDFDILCERVGKIRLNDFLAECFKNNMRVLITCKTGPEYHILRDSIETRFWESAHEIEAKRLERREFERIEQHFRANNIPIDRDAYARLDYHIGSLFMDLHTMRERYRKIRKDSFGLPHSILQILKALKLGYNQLDDRSFSKSKVKAYRNLWSGQELPVADWNRAFSILAESDNGNGFIRWTEEGNIFIEEAYLKVIINDVTDKQYLEEIEEVFPDPQERCKFGFFGVRYWTIKLNEILKFTKKEGEDFLKEMMEAGVEPNYVTFTSLINQADDADDARFWFDKMVAAGIQPDYVTFNSMINRVVDADAARFWFDKMIEAGAEPTDITFNSLINRAVDAESARSWFDKMVKAGVQPDVFTFTTLINLTTDAEAARFWFDKMVEAGVQPDDVTFTSLINRAVDADAARFWFDKMVEASVHPDIFTISSLLKKCVRNCAGIAWVEGLREHHNIQMNDFYTGQLAKTKARLRCG